MNDAEGHGRRDERKLCSFFDIVGQFLPIALDSLYRITGKVAAINSFYELAKLKVQLTKAFNRVRCNRIIKPLAFNKIS